MNDETIDNINRLIYWFDQNKDSNNIVKLTTNKDELMINAVTLGDIVSDAYALMNELEDDYKINVDKFAHEFKGSAAKAEIAARVEYSEQKKEWTQAKNAYKKLNTILERIDKVGDSVAQRISVLKQTEIKGL